MRATSRLLDGRRLFAALACAASLGWSGAGQAALVSPVTVNLVAPGGVIGDITPISETASVDPAVGLSAGDAGSPISATWMLPGERITFDNTTNSILLRVFSGAQSGTDLVTGYLGAGGAWARYEIDGLAISGQTIYGFDAFATAGSTITAITGMQVALIGDDQINFRLDSLVFQGLLANFGTSEAYADFRINLLSRDNGGGGGGGGTIPEPATLALVLAGLVALRRRPATGRAQ